MEHIIQAALPFVVAASIGYLLGSIPFGLILTKMAGYGDIRTIGSGNIGATNVLRTGNKKLAIATLLLDALKGAVAVGIIKFFFPDSSVLDCATLSDCGYTQGDIVEFCLIAAFFALLGHIFPVWLKFKGGKGVATGLGLLLALSWPTGLAAAAVWLVTAFLTRISSLSALVAILLTPVLAYVVSGDLKFTVLCLVMAAIITAKHRANIIRLLDGTEPKIGAKKE